MTLTSLGDVRVTMRSAVVSGARARCAWGGAGAVRRAHGASSAPRAVSSSSSTAAASSMPVVVITGANTGLGFESAKEIAKAGGRRVVLAVRSVERGETAKTRILAAVPGASVDVMAIDLADFASVRAFADAFKAKYDRLDVLMNNSGVMALPQRETTVDGYEKQMQTNHFGHFLLVSLLLDVMVKTESADKRIVNLSSIAHNFGTFDFHNWNSEGFPFGYAGLGWLPYGRTKMANMMFTYELDRRLKKAGITDVCTNAVHPGVVDTELNRSLGAFDFYPQLKKAGQLITSEQGARGQIAAAIAPEFTGVSGKYIAEQSPNGKPGVHIEQRSNDFSYDTEAWARLWKDSVQVTKAEWTI